MEVNDNTQ